MQDLSQFKSTYFQECAELLAQLERLLAEFQHEGDASEVINGAFRAVHSIKGGAAMFGFDRIVRFAHVVESALNEARVGRVVADPEFIAASLQAADVLADLAASAQSGNTLADGFENASLSRIAAFSDDANIQADLNGSKNFESREKTAARAQQELSTFVIAYKPGPDIFKRGLEPLTFVSCLEDLGEVSALPDLGALPDFRSLDPATAYLEWRFELKTKHSKQSVLSVFEFITSSCRLEVSEQADIPPANFHEPQVQPAKNGPVVTFGERRISSIRVETDRVEKLVDLVGEISIAQSMVLQQLDPSLIDSNPLLYRAISQLLQHSRCMQDSVMAIRAQPIKTIFSRLPRVVRDAVQFSDKLVQLNLIGEDTEIDKTIIEQISDPLMHIVRNAIDHGIESPARRREAGKPEIASITLRAEQRGGRIVVEVNDDGAGIDRAAVFARAVAMGLVDGASKLTDHEIDNLVFRPGLSTAKSVSEISGRGVGMDVVVSNIQKLGGRVAIRSEPGRGATTTITLPLTLAVLDAMLVRAGGQLQLIPLANIAECVVSSTSDIGTIPSTGNVITLRDRHIGLVDLATILGFPPAALGDRLQVVVVDLDAAGTVGLIVDEICGHRQVVVKSVRDQLHEVNGLAGATILGDGQVAFILDLAEVLSAQVGRNIHLNKSNSKGLAA